MSTKTFLVVPSRTNNGGVSPLTVCLEEIEAITYTNNPSDSVLLMKSGRGFVVTMEMKAINNLIEEASVVVAHTEDAYKHEAPSRIISVEKEDIMVL